MSALFQTDYYEGKNIEVNLEYDVFSDRTHCFFHDGPVAVVEAKDVDNAFISVEANGELRIYDENHNERTNDVPIEANIPRKRLLTNEDIFENVAIGSPEKDKFYYAEPTNWFEIFIHVRPDSNSAYEMTHLTEVTSLLGTSLEMAVRDFYELVEDFKSAIV